MLYSCLGRTQHVVGALADSGRPCIARGFTEVEQALEFTQGIQQLSQGTGRGEIQPWVTVRGAYTASGDDIVVPAQRFWIDTQKLDFLRVEAEMLEASSATLVIESAMSWDGPWTGLLTVTTAYTVQSVALSAESGAANPLQRYVRWHVESAVQPWVACFRVNARWS